MNKLILLAVAGFFVACNNSDTAKKKNADTAKKTNGIPADSVAKDATFSFIDGCMQNARITLGDQKAYAFCKCIYNQLKAQNPGADSIDIEELARDTATVNKIAATCRQ